VIAALKKATVASRGRVVATVEITSGLEAVLNKLDKVELGKLQGVGTMGVGRGTGVGAGGSAEGDFVSKGSISTGGTRAGGGGAGIKEVKVAVGEAAGDLGGLTADEINRVVKSRAGIVRACYQKELNRSPDLAGKVIVTFVIGEDGTVKSATIAAGSTLSDAAVTDCIRSNVLRLRFPPKGTRSTVTYPFLFSKA
jgi:hypothetical protein